MDRYVATITGEDHRLREGRVPAVGSGALLIEGGSRHATARDPPRPSPAEAIPAAGQLWPSVELLVRCRVLGGDPVRPLPLTRRFLRVWNWSWASVLSGTRWSSTSAWGSSGGRTPTRSPVASGPLPSGTLRSTARCRGRCDRMPPAARKAVALGFLEVLRRRWPNADRTPLEGAKRNAAPTPGKVRRSLAVKQDQGAVLDGVSSTERTMASSPSLSSCLRSATPRSGHRSISSTVSGMFATGQPRTRAPPVHFACLVHLPLTLPQSLEVDVPAEFVDGQADPGVELCLGVLQRGTGLLEVTVDGDGAGQVPVRAERVEEHLLDVRLDHAAENG